MTLLDEFIPEVLIRNEDCKFWLGLVLGAVFAVVLSKLADWLSPRVVKGTAPGLSRIPFAELVEGDELQAMRALHEAPSPTTPRPTPRLDLGDESTATSARSFDEVDEVDDAEEEDDDDDDDEEEEEGQGGAGGATTTGPGEPCDAPRFPFLHVTNLVQGSTPSRIFPNARQPQPFESASVLGKALIALRVKGAEDPFFAQLFEGKNRRFEIQFQITFKQDPRGVVYLGGELARKMQLGVVTKGLCRAILSILNRLSATIHAGFGKNMDGDPAAREPPHIVFPLYSAATKLVVTRKGQGAPPQLGEEIEETADSLRARKQQLVNRPGDLRAGDTVTFSINSMYMDIVRWKATNLGALGEMDLSMFWDTMPLHMCMYDLDSFDLRANRVHADGSKRHYFAFAIQNTYYQRAKGDAAVIYPTPEQLSAAAEQRQAALAGTAATTQTAAVSAPAPAPGSETARRARQPVPPSSPSNASEELVEDDDDDDSFRSREDSGEQMVEEETLNEAELRERQASVRAQSPADSLCTSDLRVVAWIEHNGRKKRAISFVLARADGVQVFLQSRESFYRSTLPRALNLHRGEPAKAPKKAWEWEVLRSQLESAFGLAEPAPLPRGWVDTTRTLLTARTREDMHVVVMQKQIEGGRVTAECPVVRPLWETKWNEEWAVVVQTTAPAGTDPVVYIMLYRPASKAPTLVISSHAVLAVREVDPASSTFATLFPTLRVETKGRVVLLAFASQAARAKFAERLRSAPMGRRPALSTALRSLSGLGRFSPTGSSRASGSGPDLMLSSDLATVSLANEAARWGPQKRVVLNARRIVFGPLQAAGLASSGAVDAASARARRNGSSASSTSSKSSDGGREVSSRAAASGAFGGSFGGDAAPAGMGEEGDLAGAGPEDILSKRKRLEQRSALKPWELSAILLRSALQLGEATSTQEQIRFFDLASKLRHLNIVGWASVMTEEEKLCFGLNLYHALRIHAKFLVGQPSSILGWSSFGSRISYAIGSGANAMVLSLAEIEHCILRKPMTLARTILATTYPPSKFTQMLELRRPEPRLNFCLNYGTQSCATHIPVLANPSAVDKNLDAAAAHFLQQLLKLDPARGVIHIPKVTYWYGRDFLQDTKDVSARAVGREIVEFVGEEQREQIERLMAHPDIVFRVRSFKWKCLETQRELVL